jgi:hypothetical protein
MADRWVTVKGIKQVDGLVNWVGGMEEVLYRPKVFRPVVNSVGMGIAKNFQMEITPSGRSWQGLSPHTNNIREERGYSARHPILEQSGQLKEAASGAFLKWGDNSKSSRRNLTAPYGNFEPLSMSASYGNGLFRATISGSRVSNQYGDIREWSESKYGSRERYRGRPIPARPFWGLTSEMFDWSVPQMLLIFLTEWRANAKGVRSV